MDKVGKVINWIIGIEVVSVLLLIFFNVMEINKIIILITCLIIPMRVMVEVLFPDLFISRKGIENEYYGAFGTRALYKIGGVDRIFTIEEVGEYIDQHKEEIKLLEEANKKAAGCIKYHFKIDSKVLENSDYSKVIEEVCLPMSKMIKIDSYHAYKLTAKEFSIPQRYVYSIADVSGYIMCDGIDGVLRSGQMIAWKEMLEAYKVMGLNEQYRIMKKAISLFGMKTNSEKNDLFGDNEELVYKILDDHNVEEALSELSAEFWKLDSKEEERVIYNYIIENKDSFYFDKEYEEIDLYKLEPVAKRLPTPKISFREHFCINTDKEKAISALLILGLFSGFIILAIVSWYCF